MLFGLKVSGGERLQRLLERAREQHYYTLPWPVAGYDSCPAGLDGWHVGRRSDEQSQGLVVIFVGVDAAWVRSSHGACDGTPRQ